MRPFSGDEEGALCVPAEDAECASGTLASHTRRGVWPRHEALVLGSPEADTCVPTVPGMRDVGGIGGSQPGRGPAPLL